jgi:hypothetical protein
MGFFLNKADRDRWWHDWEDDQFDELAAALVAGHLIECSTYVTGGYYSMFKDLMKTGKHVNMGFPIAEVEYDGTVTITKEKNTGGKLEAFASHHKTNAYRMRHGRYMYFTAIV